MQDINSVVITGNLTRDPELRTTGAGTPVCNLRVAVNGSRKDSETGQWGDKPNYFNVTVWGRHGEVCAEYLVKGSPVAVEGRLDWREWEVEGGGKRQGVSIVAESVRFLGTPPSDGAPQSGEPSEDEVVAQVQEAPSEVAAAS